MESGANSASGVRQTALMRPFSEVVKCVCSDGCEKKITMDILTAVFTGFWGEEKVKTLPHAVRRQKVVDILNAAKRVTVEGVQFKFFIKDPKTVSCFINHHLKCFKIS